MDASIYEDERWPGFAPISTTRHLAEQVLGTKPLFEHLAEVVGGETSLVGRSYLKAVAEQRTGHPYNEFLDGPVVCARLNPLSAAGAIGKLARAKKEVALLCGDEVAAISTRREKIERAVTKEGPLSQTSLLRLAKGVERLELPGESLFSYPWQVLALNEQAITRAAGRPKKGLQVSADAELEDFVSLDTRAGPIIIDAGAEVESFSRLAGPCYVGAGARVHSALLRAGTSIGAGAKVGGEVEQATVYPHSNKAHEGYLANSVVGEWVNIGAGAVTSNLKNTYGTVKVQRGKQRVDTGMTKLGTMIGDMAKVSIGTMIFAGKTIGVAAQCSGTVDTDIPDFAVSGTGQKADRVWLSSVLETQERMKARRGLHLTPEERSLITRLYGPG